VPCVCTATPFPPLFAILDRSMDARAPLATSTPESLQSCTVTLLSLPLVAPFISTTPTPRSLLTVHPSIRNSPSVTITAALVVLLPYELCSVIDDRGDRGDIDVRGLREPFGEREEEGGLYAGPTREQIVRLLKVARGQAIVTALPSPLQLILTEEGSAPVPTIVTSLVRRTLSWKTPGCSSTTPPSSTTSNAASIEPALADNTMLCCSEGPPSSSSDAAAAIAALDRSLQHTAVSSQLRHY
jgi:hypothetical protein